MYNDPSLQLVGSPPPTAGSRPGSSASNMFLFSDRSYQHGYDKSSRYENELFGPVSGRSSALSPPASERYTNGFSSKPPRTPTTPVNSKTQILNKKNKSYGKKSKQAKHNPSYTDELLFGSTTPTAEERLWQSSKVTKQVAQTPTSSDGSIINSNYYTKKLNQSDTRAASRPASRQNITRRSPSPASHRPQTASTTRPGSAGSPKKKNRNRHNASYVDEMLFGPKLEEADFPAPWDTQKEAKPYTFDMTDYKARPQSVSSGPRPSSAVNGTSRPPSARPSSRQNLSARPGSRASSVVNGKPPTPRKGLFKKSYVDESLFGPKMEECEWDAPWENLKDKYKKPLIYDSSDYKMRVEHSDIPRPKPKVRSSLHKSISRSTSSLDKKPVWR